MPASSAREIRCGIQRTLDVLGEKWTLLLVREALWGKTRFAEFRVRLGIAPDVLTDRLNKLVDAGVLERRPYREAGEREREEYVLTSTGRALAPVLSALSGWGDAYLPTGHGPASDFRETATGAPVQLAFATRDGHLLEPDAVELVPGPGALSDPRVRIR
ncbi:MAG: helix-turn-helix domain-containing protein [Pseudolysinimonas sp.]